MMKRLNVLHVTFDMAIGGTEQVIRQIIESTDAGQFSTSIACIDSSIGALGLELQKQGVDVTCLKRRAGFDRELIKNLRQHIVTNDIDVVHCHQYTPYIYGLLASFRTQAKVVFTEHGRFYPDSYRWKRVVLNPILAFKTAAITAISASTANALSRYENFPRRKIAVIYNGIADVNHAQKAPDDLRQQLNIKPQQLVMGTISRLDPIKNQTMMISAFKEVTKQHPNTVLLIVGDGPIRQDLEQHTHELGLTEQVIFTGFKVNPKQYLQLMDVFLLSSLSEGTSMTLLEAMAFSKPVVVTNVGGNPEIAIDGETGLITPSKNTDAFAKAMLTLLNDKQQRRQLGEGGRRRYEANFSVNSMTASYQQLYSQILS